MDIENQDTGEKTHIPSPPLPDNGQWSDPEMIEAPKVKHLETGRIFVIAEINFAAKYVTFIVDDEDFTFEDDNGQMRTYPVGSLCMKRFEDNIEIE